MPANLPKIPAISDTSSLIDKTLLQLIEGVTGLASSDRKDLILSVGHLFQSMLTGKFLSILKDEWDGLKDRGEIKEEYQDSEQHRTCLKEMLDFLDSDRPDEARFSFLKKIFFGISTEDLTDRNSLLPQQYMRICRTLTSGDILILSASYKVVMTGNWVKGNCVVRDWFERIVNESGLKYPELVEFHEKNLIEKQLLLPRVRNDPRVTYLGEFFRLTPLAYDICKFIEVYDKLNGSETIK